MATKTKKKNVDFKEIKKRVTVEGVLLRFDVRLRKSGESLRGSCPLPCGQDGGKGCFSVSPGKQTFYCHHTGCGWTQRRGGDVIELVKALESCSLREAALKLAEWFRVGESQGMDDAGSKKQEPPANGQGCGISRQVETGVINPPLGFELKRVDPEKARAYAESRGFDEEAVERFGLTVALGGRLAGRLAIPIHDNEGNHCHLTT